MNFKVKDYESKFFMDELEKVEKLGKEKGFNVHTHFSKPFVSSLSKILIFDGDGEQDYTLRFEYTGHDRMYGKYESLEEYIKRSTEYLESI